jgi:hypothetical protein
MDAKQSFSRSGDDRHFDTIVRLLGIASPELRPALDQVSDLVSEALGADKVDVFLFEVASESWSRWVPVTPQWAAGSTNSGWTACRLLMAGRPCRST